MPSSRTVVRWAAALLALAGWVGALWSWLDHGDAAGVNPGFITALSVGITFTIVWARAVADFQDRNEERVYALGVRHGLALGAEVAQAKRDVESLQEARLYSIPRRARR